jgi:hypothetical protein
MGLDSHQVLATNLERRRPPIQRRPRDSSEPISAYAAGATIPSPLRSNRTHPRLAPGRPAQAPPRLKHASSGRKKGGTVRRPATARKSNMRSIRPGSFRHDRYRQDPEWTTAAVSEETTPFAFSSVVAHPSVHRYWSGRPPRPRPAFAHAAGPRSRATETPANGRASMVSIGSRAYPWPCRSAPRRARGQSTICHSSSRRRE